ncbi:beta-ketoacyl synthase N-terminal-like domain-containing protein [Luteibacter sp. CQ10]|uniref:beta-ketoacyl synthase N-terminal-like domain-containing protein n=1 Tax=Luteibacter sp. CQ10 TaxID=2805821 RepID=UPI0034A1FC1A
MSGDVVITGVGVGSAIGHGKDAFLDALLDGRSAFDIMRRPGRQHGQETSFIGAEMDTPPLPDAFETSLPRGLSLSGRLALTTLHEAWEEASLGALDPRRIGLIVGGSNFQQREIALLQEKYRDREAFLRPTYGMTFMDTDVVASCTSLFGIRGPSYNVAGASASGQLAILRAVQAVRSGEVDACIALGPLMDLSYWECIGLRALGAMGSDRHADAPSSACRPFDTNRDGFIFGECGAAIVVERATRARRAGVRPYATVCGWGLVLDGNRNPDPSIDGEVAAIRAALEIAGCRASDIDYVNPHGTGSPLGDETELKALRACGLDSVAINATKSVTGHGLCAAGAVEVAATVLQMRAERLHPTLNLEEPIDNGFDWVRGRSVPRNVRHAITLSMGFGGVNTALCLRHADEA